MIRCSPPSLALVVAIAEAVGATAFAMIFLYLYLWWRARAHHLDSELVRLKEAILLSPRHRRDRRDRDQETPASG